MADGPEEVEEWGNLENESRQVVIAIESCAFQSVFATTDLTAFIGSDDRLVITSLSDVMEAVVIEMASRITKGRDWLLD
jgi:hypothetical protein